MVERENKLRPPTFGETPWLVYTHGNDRAKKIQTFCPMSTLPTNNNYYIKSIPELRGKSILASFDEWLILRDLEDKKIFSLWNILTLEQISLPKLYALDEYDNFHDDVDNGNGEEDEEEHEEEEEEDDEIFTCILTSAPDDKDSENCAVLLFREGMVYSCQLRRGKAASWNKQTVQLDGEKAEIDHPVMCNGVLYGWAESDNGSVLLSVEFANDGSNLLIFKSLGVKKPVFGPCVHSLKLLTYFLESCGGLYLIVIRIRQVDSMEISKVKVWELDFEGMSWEEVKSLGNRTFFLGMHSCTWCWASTEPESMGYSVEGNCLYFILEDDETLYSYGLGDDNFSFYLPCANLPTPFCGPAWVIPKHQSGSLLSREASECTAEKVDIRHRGSNIVDQQREVQEQSEMLEKQRELPSDIIALISKYLHLFDYLNFRASCKTFQSIMIPTAQWKVNNLFPLLMFPKNRDGLCVLRDPFRDDSHSIMIPHSPEVPTSIEFSKDGWLVVCTGKDSLQFFNPYTRVRGEFPPYDSVHLFASVGFSTSPISSDCLTVGIIDGWDYISLNFFRSSDETWHRHDFNHEDVEFLPSHSSPVYHSGAFYFLDQSGYLGVFELVQEEASWRVYDRPQTWDDVVHSCHLLECNGQLLSVFFGKVGKWVQVFEFNHSKKDWVEVKSLGNYILLISSSSSFSILAREQGTENRIYLPWRKGNDIVFYSLETGKYHAVGNEDPMENFYGLQGQSLCCWV